MKIRQIRSFKKDLRLTKPYTVAYQTFTTAVNVILEVELEDGVTGLGAAAEGTFVTGETMEDTLGTLESEFLQRWVGSDIRHFRGMIEESGKYFPNYPATRAAIDIALHDAFCRYLGIPVVDLYGRKHISMPTSVTIGIKGIEETLAEAKEYMDKGFRVLKVKTGRDIDLDIARCARLRSEFGEYLTIRVDANQGYDVSETLRFYSASEELGIELIEQPLPAGCEQDLKLLPEDLRSMLACDESLKDARTALQLASHPRGCGIFNIKLMKCGGIAAALDIANIAHAADIQLFWGCFDESSVSISAALHAAFACEGTRYLDLDGSLDLAEDVVSEGFEIKNGIMTILEGPGLGFRKL
jgi:L-Ala-D/L-Glu epimerase